MDAEPQGLLGVSVCDEKGFSGYYVGVAGTRPARRTWRNMSFLRDLGGV